MSILPKALSQAIDAFLSLPGVGPRTAERYAYWCLRHDHQLSESIANSLESLHANIKICPVTFAYMDAKEKVSPLYTDPKRDKSVIAVVAEPFDIVAMEKIGLFSGTYHVLGGLISPIDGVNPEDLHIDALVNRIKNDKVSELILAINASVEGETTALYIQQKLAHTMIKLTRLARGLPIGVDLEYADQITLQRALENRTAL